jgi:O-methyltransferase
LKLTFAHSKYRGWKRISRAAGGNLRKLRRALRARRAAAIYHKYHAFTMVSRHQAIANLVLCAEQAPAGGCIVECGAWRGGMSAAIADMLPGRAHFLLDSFEGLPPVREIDGPLAVQYQRETSDNCRVERSFAEQAMRISAAGKFEIVQGWFKDTLPQLTLPGPIAVLRIDGDWYDSTMDCLRHLYPRVMPGGLIILDDYYAWDGCARAVHDYLSAQKAAERIHVFKGVVYLLKRIPG